MGPEDHLARLRTNQNQRFCATQIHVSLELLTQEAQAFTGDEILCPVDRLVGAGTERTPAIYFS